MEAAKESTSSCRALKRSRGERSVNDEEVEEFFTILKRLQEVKRLRAGIHSAGVERTRCRMTWQPEFTFDDFREVVVDDKTDRNDDVDRRDRRSAEATPLAAPTRSFDLNAEPPDVEIIDGRD